MKKYRYLYKGRIIPTISGLHYEVYETNSLQIQTTDVLLGVFEEREVASEITALKAENDIQYRNGFEDGRTDGRKLSHEEITALKAENEKLKSALKVAKDAFNKMKDEIEYCEHYGCHQGIHGLTDNAKISIEALQEISRIEGENK